ncbi:Mov34/MPN/PAD-1 family protein [Bacteroidia bacterium]|nr:Mov34/MPN/PAD-1 family protein [Bacteroidia bacterium]
MIVIPQHIIFGIIEQAKNELPNEACGLLVGKGMEVIKQYSLTNVDHSPEHFSFDPKEQFGVLREARKEGWEILANYHSHPESPARPSEEDIRLAFDPNIIYIILSLQDKDNPVIKAFSIQNGKVVEIVIAGSLDFCHCGLDPQSQDVR